MPTYIANFHVLFRDNIWVDGYKEKRHSYLIPSFLHSSFLHSSFFILPAVCYLYIVYYGLTRCEIKLTVEGQTN